MAYQETAAAVLINNPEVVQGLQVKVRPTEQRIDALPNSQTPTRTFITREGNSFVIENAVRIHVGNLNGDGEVSIGIEPVCLQHMVILGFLPIRIDQEIICFGEVRKIKVWKAKPHLKKVTFAITQPRQIIDEFKERQEASYKLDGKEGAF